MPRWVWITLIGMPLFISSCVGVGYFAVGPAIRTFVSHGQAAVSEQMAETIATSVAISVPIPDGSVVRIQIREQELEVNNAVATDSVGIDTGTEGTYIYGFVTSIDEDGISLLANNEVMYSGMPVVSGRRIDLTNVQALQPGLRLFLTSTGFEQAMENGINRALSARGLTPVRLILGDGVLTIVAEPTSTQPQRHDLLQNTARSLVTR